MSDTERQTPRYVICVNNEGYPASLELRRVYRVVPDAAATRHRLLRVTDESGDDYLYPEDYFVAIVLPEAAERAFATAA